MNRQTAADRNAARDRAATSRGGKNGREVKMATTRSATLSRWHGRRDFLKKSVGAIATATFGIARKAFAAEPVNIGGPYPLTGSFAQIGQGGVNAAKLAAEKVNHAGGTKSLRRAKMNLCGADVQDASTVTPTQEPPD